MFRNAKVGDRVWSFANNWGTIKKIELTSDYPITIKFDNNITMSYTSDGRCNEYNVSPTLFWDEIKFDIPEKPFNLEEELRKLEIKEFELEEINYSLVWDHTTYDISYKAIWHYQIPLIIYFEHESILNFMERIKDKKITKEEFFKAYKNVFGGK